MGFMMFVCVAVAAIAAPAGGVVLMVSNTRRGVADPKGLRLGTALLAVAFLAAGAAAILLFLPEILERTS